MVSSSIVDRVVAVNGICRDIADGLEISPGTPRFGILTSVDGLPALRFLADEGDRRRFVEDWSRLYRRSAWPHFAQSPQWLASKLHGQGFVAVASEGTRGFTAVSLMRTRKMPGLGRYKYFIDRGPLALDADALRRHLETLCAVMTPSGIWVHSGPYAFEADSGGCEAALADAGFRPREECDRYVATVTVDLGGSLSEVRSAFRRSLKAQLNKSGRSGIEVRRVTDPGAYSEFSEVLARHKGLAPGTCPEELSSDLFFEQFVTDTNRCACFAAVLNGNIVAGIVLLTAGTRVVYQWGFSSKDKHAGLPLSHSLHWHAIQWAHESGWAYYDLGGYWLDRGNEDAINRFKTGFSKRIDVLIPEHERILSPASAGLARVGGWLRAVAGG